MLLLDDETRPAARQGLWVGFATGLYGLSFGALAVAAGLSVWQAVALSALLFSGGSQFALIGVLASGGSGVVAVQTFDAGGAVRLDARAAGLLAAVVALMLRAPFLLVIVMAAATAAALRALGIG